MDMDYSACAALVQKGDPTRFVATMAADPKWRDGLFTLAAFNLELARAPWASKEAMICEMRLQWWADLAEAMGRGEEPRAHEVAAPLARLAREKALPTELMQDMADARRWDIYTDPFEDEAAFTRYIDRTSGHLLWLAALTLGARPEDEASVRKFAYGVGVANWLAAVADLADRGKIPLLDGRPEGVQALALQGLEAFNTANPPKALAPALRWGWQSVPLLKLAIKSPETVAEGRLALRENSAKMRLFAKAILRRA
jgi:hypothetical protein